MLYFMLSQKEEEKKPLGSSNDTSVNKFAEHLFF